MKSKDTIPDEVLKEIFPKELKRSPASERVYVQLKKMITSRRLKRGEKLLQDGIAQDFNVSKMAVTIAFSQLKKDRFIISRRGVGSFVA